MTVGPLPTPAAGGRAGGRSRAWGRAGGRSRAWGRAGGHSHAGGSPTGGSPTGGSPTGGHSPTGASPRAGPVNTAGADRGTSIPLIMLCFMLAGTFICASIAASAAFLAQRDLAGVCDGAAIAAANAYSRAAASGGASGTDGPESLPLDEQAVQRAVAAYRLHVLPAGAERAGGDPADSGGLSITASTDGRVATVACRRRVRIPFGTLLGYRDGLDRTVVARARSPLD